MASDEYASKGVAGAGLGLGIAGTALALLRDRGGLGGILGGGNGGERTLDFAYMLENERRLAKLEAEAAANKVATEKDAEISVLRSTVGIERATKHMVSGQVYLAPHNMADPYQGGRNVLMAQHFNGVPGELRNPYRDPWY